MLARIRVSIAVQPERCASRKVECEGVRAAFSFQVPIVGLQALARTLIGCRDPLGGMDVPVIYKSRHAVALFLGEVEIELDRQRLHGQGTGYQIDVGKAVGHVFAVGIVDCRVSPAGHRIAVLVLKGVRHVVKIVLIGSRIDHREGAARRTLIGQPVRQAFDGDSARTELGAVIDLFGRGGGKGDLCVVLGDCKGTQALGEGVVAALGAAPVDGIGVVRGADVGDRAGGGDRDIAFLRRHNAGDGSLEAGQRGAVVGLLGGAGGDCGGSRIYGQSAVYSGDFCELIRHFFAVFIVDRVRCDLVFAASCVCPAAGNGGGDRETVRQAVRSKRAVRQGGAVVGLPGGSGREGHLSARRAPGHPERSELL